MNSDSTITGGNAEINTLDGNAGSDSKPLNLDVDKLDGTIGGDADITNKGDLEAGDLSVDGDLDLTVNGDLTAGDKADGTANITADNAVLNVNGDVGTDDKPLDLDVNSLTINGKDVDIHTISDTEIVSITGKDIDIDADGDITAGDNDVNITGDNLDIDAFGDVGKEGKPLVVQVTGDVNINSEHGSVNVKRVYPRKDDNGSGTDTAAEQPWYGTLIYNDKWEPAPKRVAELEPDIDLTDLFADEEFREELIRRLGDEDKLLKADLILNDGPDKRLILRKLEGGSEAYNRLADELIGTILEDWREKEKAEEEKEEADEAADKEAEEDRIFKKSDRRKLFGVFTLSDDLLESTEDFRYLVLDEEVRKELADREYRWIFFRSGDRMLVIDLTQLKEEGE